MTSDGVWFGQSNQYIGVRLNGSSLGWIKISLPITNPNAEQVLIIEEFGCVL